MKILLLSLLIFFETSLAFPQNGTWITLAPMPTLRQEMPIVQINTKIYVIGGLLQNNDATSVNEIYTPWTNTWSTGDTLPSPRHHHMVAVANGKIYIMGGYITTFNGQNNNFEYDPISNTWTNKAPLPTPRGAGVAAELNGKIYLFGGLDQSGNILSITEEYDPQSNTWEIKAPMPTAREHLAAAVLDSLIYVVGGRDFNGGPGNYPLVEAYSPATDTWYTINDMSVASGGLAAESSVGKVFKFGGEIPVVFEEVERFDPSTGLWEFDTPMKTPRHGMGAVNFNDTIYVIGGGTVVGLQATNINEAFIPDGVISVQQISTIAEDFRLHQNFPNPFNPSTTIRFDIPGRGLVTLSVFDINGREVDALVNEELSHGSYGITWNAGNYSSGVYYYRLIFNGNVSSMKMILIK